MAAGTLKLKFDAGTTWRKTLTWTDPDGALIDFTGYTASWEFSTSPSFSGGDVFHVAAGAELTLNSSGLMILSIPDDVRDDWPTAAMAHHHLNVTLPSGAVERWLEGRVFVDD